MNRVWLVVLAGVVLGTSCTAAEEACAAPAPAAAPAKSVALVAVGHVDAALVDRVSAFVRSETQLPIRVLPARKRAAKAAADEAAGVAKAMAGSDVCAVALVSAEGEAQAPLSISAAQRVALVNVKALAAGAAGDEAVARRVEKETMKSIGTLLGASECPNPQCALWSPITPEEMDAKGRTFCPPCLEKVQQLGAARVLVIADK